MDRPGTMRSRSRPAACRADLHDYELKNDALRIDPLPSARCRTSCSLVIVGANVGVKVTVSNAAPVQFANGADKLDYTFSSSGSLSGGANVTGLMALSAGNTHTLAIDFLSMARSPAWGSDRKFAHHRFENNQQLRDRESFL